jgi:hypothetical protein
MKISDRALAILQHIADCSENGESWLPSIDTRYGHDYSRRSESYLNIAGSGDARILKSLGEKGLICKRRDDCGPYHWLAATDTGLQLLAKQAERVDSIFEGLRKDRELRDRLSARGE